MLFMALAPILIVACVPKKTTTKGSTSIPTELGKNDTVPNAPTVTTPAYNPFTTAADQFTVSGVCATDNMVSISGASLQAVKCVNNSYSFVVKQTIDAAYTYYLAQKSPSGIVSAKTTFVWTRSQTVSPVVITSPPSSPYLSNNQTLTIAGTCVPSMVVAIAGDHTASATCDANSAFSFAVTKTADGTFGFGVTQTDSIATSVSSATFSLSWTLDTTAPTVPTLITPAVSPHTTTSSSVTVTVGCEDGNTVTVTGDKQASGVCSGSTYTFSDTRAAFGTYNYSFTQTDLAGNTSPSLAFQWNYVATFVPPIAVTGPAYNDLAVPKTKYVSNEGTLVLNGTCLTGYTIELTGSAIQNATCTALGTFQFNINQTADVTDGTYTFLMLQRDPNNGTPSASVQYIWNRDITSPDMVSLISPVSSPHTGASLSVVVGCDTDNALTVSGVNAADGLTYNATGTCVASQFTFVDNTQINDGTISYGIIQNDLAQNSSVAYNFVWIRDTKVPVAPSISFAPVSPASPIDPSRSDVVVVTGTCSYNHTVNLSGDVQSDEVTGNLLYQTCGVGNTYSFTVDKSLDLTAVKTFVFNVNQMNPINNLSSTPVTGSWTRDKEALAPVLSVPTTATFTSNGGIDIQGTCENNGIVYLTMSNPSLNENTTCTSSAFTFTKTGVTGGTYTYSLHQIDYAGNTSVATNSREWQVVAGAPPNPTISSPPNSPSPYVTSGSILTIIGACENTDAVVIWGDVDTTSGADLKSPGVTTGTHTCTGSAYRYDILKTTDGTFTINVKQTNAVPLDSGTETRIWLKDSTAPSITVGTTTPTGVQLGTVFPSPSPTPTINNSNLQYAAQITFSATDVTGASFQCKLDGGAYSNCTSPLTYNSVKVVGGTLTEGAYHSVTVQAKDAVLNTSTLVMNWYQRAFNTLALYHFNNSASDNSAYATSDLSVGGGSVTYSAATKALGSHSAYLNGSSYFTVNDNKVQDLGSSLSLTVEAFVSVGTLPTSGKMVIASKNGGAGDYGWEFGIQYISGSGNGAKYKLYFAATTDLNTAPTYGLSAQFNANSINTSTLKHVAATVSNGGQISLFYDGIATINAITLPVTGVALSNSIAPLLIGSSSANPTFAKFNGYIDEFRISRTVRYSAAYTPTAIEFTNVVTDPAE
jgi:hypothetical protein